MGVEYVSARDKPECMNTLRMFKILDKITKYTYIKWYALKSKRSLQLSGDHNIRFV